MLADSPIADVMARLLRTDRLWLFLDQIFVKAGGRSNRSPWHQDVPWLMADGNQFATIWIALQPLEVDETLEFVAGSHLGPVYDHAVDWTPEKLLPTSAPKLPNIEAERENWPIVSHASQPASSSLGSSLGSCRPAGVGR